MSYYVLTCAVLLSAAAAAGAAGDGPPSAWRPFADDSPWNTPIAADAVVDPRSPRYIGTLAEMCTGDYIFLNTRKWSIPVWWVDVAQTPRYDVTGIKPWILNNVADADGNGVAEAVPIPPWAQPDEMRDGHMCVADWERGVAYDFLQTEYHGPGDWRARAVDVWDLAGPGVHPPGVPSCRGSGFPLLAGLILPHELAAGEIRHALALAMPNTTPAWYIYPASATDGHAVPDMVVPEGARVQLDPTLDLETLGLSREGKIIARALQVYGAYVCDNAGGFVLYAQQNSPAFEGVLEGDELGGITLDKLRVLKLGDAVLQADDPTK